MAYEMRISDWSSDVCSSDLGGDDESLRSFDIKLRSRREQAEGVLVLRGGRIITMKGAEIINNGSIVIRNGRITDIGPSSIVDTPQDAIVRDMSGMTIMPGMIDMHAHIKPPKNVVVNHWWEFISYIEHGVTTIRDPSIDSDLPVWGDVYRSEERRVGKECVSNFRYRWSSYH